MEIRTLPLTASQKYLWEDLARIKKLRRSSTIEDISGWIRTHLEGTGVDLNFRMGNPPQSPLDLAGLLYENPDVERAAVVALIHFGANPLLDQAFMLRMFRGADGVNTCQDFVAEALAKQELAGNKLRGPKGENFFHFMANFLWLLPDHTSSHGLDVLWRGWIREKTVDGDTPLHRSLADLNEKQENTLPDLLQYTWDGFEPALNLIVRECPEALEIPNAKGQVCLDAIQSIRRANPYIRFSDPMLSSQLDKMEAVRLEARLSKNTPTAKGLRRAGRL